MNEAPDDRIMVRLPGDLLRALDRFIEEHEGREDRPQAVISALREWAHARGYLDEPGEEGMRPEDLSAANDG
jgi:metal-responsive CopG/Arc/MetJ family transcriptional regulator